MAVFDRDPAQERRQILDISANVARRLLDVLDRSRYAHASLKAEIEDSVTVITGIQRDVDQIVTGMPAYEALDVAILTHILGGLQHALERLEDLEAKLQGSQHHQPNPFDPARSHAALIATAREIEREALRYGALPHPPVAQPAFGGGVSPYQVPPPRTATQRAAAPPPGGPPQRPRSAAPTPKPKGRAGWAASLPGLDFGTILAGPRTTASLGILAVLGIALAAWMFFPGALPPAQDPGTAEQQAATAPHTEEAAPFTKTAANAAAIGPSMEQPYLVVLATRRSTEELQQDYRTFKQSYADLLAGSKARVDRIQGQDRQTYYRLSLIPPQSRDEAKTLCGRLRSAGLSGCWIRQVPFN